MADDERNGETSPKPLEVRVREEISTRESLGIQVTRGACQVR
jgi:hypothetical protein